MKKILIIGATSAIAQEVAKIYATQKHELILWGRNSQMLTAISQDLTVRGASKVSVIAHDLNDFSRHEEFVTNIWKDSKTIDIALLAHGVLGDPRKAETTQSELFKLLNSNFVSHASLLAFISTEMIHQGHGTIAVISSVAGDRGKQSNYVYGSAKAGMTAYVDGLRNRLFKTGVHVLNLKLGPVDTPMTKDHKKGPLFGKAPQVGAGIVTAIEKKKNTVYLPFFWRYIMWIICSIPESIFKKLSL
ncbi:SDR family oxidoreductase [Bdellovibrio sp. KM01]|uniref:SDR family oxidoreductase n=1 Tax=Bdellovibrio sp. KM01 TaxID=2748865 RepID=UPI0015EB01DA|nr:SDR family oxidoreductase [Bdellovibrio sp. KM01]QLY27033.1 SDR family oxidoreductase [Bdellovibrio sp. KM01]